MVGRIDGSLGREGKKNKRPFTRKNRLREGMMAPVLVIKPLTR
jgi:hypothetical protein